MTNAPTDDPWGVRGDPNYVEIEPGAWAPGDSVAAGFELRPETYLRVHADPPAREALQARADAGDPNLTSLAGELGVGPPDSRSGWNMVVAAPDHLNLDEVDLFWQRTADHPPVEVDSYVPVSEQASKSLWSAVDEQRDLTKAAGELGLTAPDERPDWLVVLDADESAEQELFFWARPVTHEPPAEELPANE